MHRALIQVTVLVSGTAVLFQLFTLAASAEQRRVATAQIIKPAMKEEHYTFEGRSLNETQYHALLQYNDSLKDIQAANWADADKKLRAAIAGDPDLYQAHANHAMVLARLGQLEEAQKEADLAYKMAPDKPEPIVARAAVELATGHLAESASDYQQFVARFPNHPMAATARSLVQQLKTEANRTADAAAGADKSANDYFSYATYDAVTKWPANEFPLRVFIPSDHACADIPGYHPAFSQALHQSFLDWASNSKGTVSFQFVDEPDDANIVCRFTNDARQVAHPSEGGEANVLYDPIHGIQHSKITLLTQQPGSGDVPVNLIKAAALHEVGHSLGLLGHSPNPNDVMFCSMPSADTPRELSARDENTLIHLYRPDVALATHDHGEGGNADKVTLNNEGIKYASSQQFSKAVQKFEAALKIDPNFEASKRNLSSCLNNLGIEAARNGQYNEALNRLQRALALEGNTGDNQKRASILRNLVSVYTKLNRPGDAARAREEIQQLQ